MWNFISSLKFFLLALQDTRQGSCISLLLTTFELNMRQGVGWRGCWPSRYCIFFLPISFTYLDYRKINPTWSSSKDTPPWSSERRRRAEVICRKFAWLLTTTPQSQTADQLARLWTQDQFRGPKFQPWSVWETDRLFDSRFLDTASRHWRKGSKQWEGSFCCPCGVLILLVKRPMIF